MAEFCAECVNKILQLDDFEKRYILSDELDFCEECNQMKRVVVRMRRRYIWRENIRQWLTDLQRFRKSGK